MSDQEADLEALTISFAGLDITVRRRASRTARSSEEDFVLVEAPPSGPAVAPDEALLEAYSASALAALHLLQLARFSDRLTGAGGEWTAARTARAYRAGVGARRFLAGGHKISSPPAAGPSCSRLPGRVLDQERPDLFRGRAGPRWATGLL